MARDGDDPTLWTFSVGPRKGKPMVLLEPEYGHWLWQGNTSGGYGVITYNPADPLFKHIRIGRKRGSGPGGRGWKAIMTHQLFYFLKYGNPPLYTELGHTCNRRSCCHPDHVRPIQAIQNKAEMYRMPDLSRDERAAVEEAILDDQPLRQIADYYNVSVWSVRKIANEIVWRDQYSIFDSEVPF